MKVLLSIKPKYVQKIFSGQKKFEFRKNIFKKNISSVVIYSSSPVKKIVGEFTIKNILEGKIEYIWQQTYKFAGITKEEYLSYFNKKNKAFAIEINEIKKYNNPIDPLILFSKNFTPPQSYKYIT